MIHPKFLKLFFSPAELGERLGYDTYENHLKQRAQQSRGKNKGNMRSPRRGKQGYG